MGGRRMLASMALGLAGVLSSPPPALPAADAPRFAGPQGPRVVSPEVSADRKVAFRILAPKAAAVRLSAGDIPSVGRGAEMAKGAEGVWEVVLGPLAPGAYRYTFDVDGVATADPGTPRRASRTATSGAWWSSPARTSWTPSTCPTAPSPR